MPQKNACCAVISIFFGALSMIVIITGVSFVIDMKYEFWVAVEVMIPLVIGLGFTVCTLVATIGNYETWRDLVSPMKIAYYVILGLSTVILAVAVSYLVWLIRQNIDERIAVLIAIAMYFAGSSLVVIILTTGMAVPMFCLYNETTTFGYAYVPVERPTEKPAENTAQAPQQPYQIIFPRLQY